MSKDPLKISIVVPSFNQGHFLEETINSVLNQSYGNYELIIIDGGSSDRSIDIIKKYENHLSYWISEKDSGQSEAINKGLKKTTGDIVTWLNSDDVYEKNALQFVADAFDKEQQLKLFHGKTMLFGEKIKNKLVGPDQDFEPHEYLPFMRFPQPSSFFSKIALEKITPLNNDLHYAMDFELVVKLVLLEFKTQRSSEILSRYRFHPQSKSNNGLAFLKDWSEVFINVLHSLPNGHRFIDKLRHLNISSQKKATTYASTIQFSDAQLEAAFLLHLDLHFHHHYKYFNYKECRRIGNFLKKYHTAFYIRKQYKKYLFRLKFVPKFIYALAGRS